MYNYIFFQNKRKRAQIQEAKLTKKYKEFRF